MLDSKRRMVSVLLAFLLHVSAVGLAEAQDGDPFAGTEVEPIVARMAEVANALIASADQSPITNLLYGLSQEERLALPGDDAARLDWGYWPRPRPGLPLRFMTASQRRLTHELLSTALSVKGYLKATHIMQLENVLAALETTALPRDIGDYALALFGDPSAAEPWAWRFEGHHLSLNISVLSANTVQVTPSFLGASPAEIRSGPMAGLRPLRLEQDLGRELLFSLSDAQRERAILSDSSPGDIIARNLFRDPDDWGEWRTLLRPDGLPVAEMEESQRLFVRRILDEVVTTYQPAIARDHLRRIVVDDLHFAWMGSTDEGEPHYYRIQGPDFVFEFDDSDGDQGHIHTVWRSRADDFGGSVLEEHYQRSHR